MIMLDGTAKQCCEAMGVSLIHFYKLVYGYENVGHAYTIRRIKARELETEVNE